MRNFIICLLAFLCVLGCSPKIKSNITSKKHALPYDADIFVFGVNQNFPVKGIQVVGSIYLGDTGFTTNCDYKTMIAKAKLEARKAGANIIKITEHKKPTILGSSCHRIKAQLYFTKDVEVVKNSEYQKEPDLLDTKYALLHVYRYSGVGSLINYNLHFGDSIICRVRNNFKTTIKLTEKGLNKIWAKTETKTELPIDVVHGKQYYLRCGVGAGILLGRPSLEFVDYQTGRAEFDSFEAKHTNKKSKK